MKRKEKRERKKERERKESERKKKKTKKERKKKKKEREEENERKKKSTGKKKERKRSRVEGLLLASMAYDRYVAICFPLHYPMRISRRLCVLMITGSWIMGSINSCAHTTYALHIPYCRSRAINHFFCDVPAMLTLACMDTWVYEYTVFVSTSLFLLLPFIGIACSYGRVLLAVYRMRSAEGRKKAYSTCSAHLTVVTFYYAPFVYTYLRPRSLRSPAEDKALAVFYTILTPTLNPIIYSLRNKEKKLWKARNVECRVGFYLSLIDLNYISTIVPKMASNFLFGNKSISFIGCGIQSFFFLTLAGAEGLLLASMAYDRYVAICFPLHYPMRISRRVCVLMITGSWIMGSINSCAHTTYALHIPYCRSRAINHFFCDVPAMLTLACMDTWVYEYTVFVSTSLFLLLPFIGIACSYGRVLLAVYRVRSAEGRKRAYSTCSAHLTVVTLYYAPFVYTYLRPRYLRSPAEDKVLAVFYTILTPMLNPIIYSLRNKEAMGALRRVIQQICFVKMWTEILH
ncbi:Olfactory receptor 2L8 [Camelus dromedarius]|uniref:Olfactory receptor 2L8 n=1 Tax=Camelus dromedarius TaxID=9838 RepID=A0A5N4EC61_CAMDR|nr:Olfactory receptor 2L8 [Camelus dromedarius]